MGRQFVTLRVVWREVTPRRPADTPIAVDESLLDVGPTTTTTRPRCRFDVSAAANVSTPPVRTAGYRPGADTVTIVVDGTDAYEPALSIQAGAVDDEGRAAETTEFVL